LNSSAVNAIFGFVKIQSPRLEVSTARRLCLAKSRFLLANSGFRSDCRWRIFGSNGASKSAHEKTETLQPVSIAKVTEFKSRRHSRLIRASVKKWVDKRQARKTAVIPEQLGG
jgi:hypothetical protein